jgi:hypothetical protein
MLSRKDAVFIACRIITIYFLTLAVADATYLPHYAFELRESMATLQIAAGRSAEILESARYYRNYHALVFAEMLSKLLLWLILARLFYSAGPAVHRFFGIEDQPEMPGPERLK